MLVRCSKKSTKTILVSVTYGVEGVNTANSNGICNKVGQTKNQMFSQNSVVSQFLPLWLVVRTAGSILNF